MALFGPRNIVKNTLSIQYIMPSEDTADSVCVEYFSENTWKTSEVTGTFSGSTSDKTATVELFGCTNKAQALREAVYMALAKVLMNYKKIHGLNTVRQIISRYAPPNENQTKAYIKTVAEQIGVYPDTVIDIEERGILTVFIKAVIRMENDTLLRIFS